MIPRTAIDLTATVTTPENIQFEYRIAGPFRRLPAFVMDGLVRIGLLIGLIILFNCSGMASLLALPGSLYQVFLLLILFFLDWFYGLFFETYWNGKTPGKWLAKIQVISTDGRPISAYQATIRNFLRSADIAPYLSLEVFDPDFPPMYGIPTGLVAFLCMACTKRFQRLGDLAAGTMVVVDERAWVPPNVRLEDPRVEALSQYIPASFRMSRSMGRAIALYAERRGRMPVSRRLELASILAVPLIRRFGFREDTGADLLLCALYYREFVAKDAASIERATVPRELRSEASTAEPLKTAEPEIAAVPMIAAEPTISAEPPTTEVKP